MRILIFWIICTLLCSQPAFADEADTVKIFAKQKINEVIDHIRNKRLDKKIRDEKIIATISPM